MIENEDVFDNLYRSYGGRARRPADSLNLNLMFDVLIGLLKKSHPRLPDVHLDLVASNLVNASATKGNDKYFIGINYGA